MKTSPIQLFSIFLAFIVLTTCRPLRTVDAKQHSKVISISFECNLLDNLNNERILEPYDMYFNILIENKSIDTLYFGSSNIYGFFPRKYGHFLLLSPTDSIELNTTLDSPYAIPPETNFYIDAVCTEFETVKQFTVSTESNPDEFYEKINMFKLLFVPKLDDFTPQERKHLVFPSSYIFDLDFVNVSYLSEGKTYLEFINSATK